jgi:hypothetical protein
MPCRYNEMEAMRVKIQHFITDTKLDFIGYIEKLM